MEKTGDAAMVIRFVPLHWATASGGLNKRAFRALRSAGVRHLGELSEWTRQDLGRLENIHTATALHIEAVMRIHGFNLRTEPQSLPPRRQRRR